MERLERQAFDWRMSLLPPPETGADIVVVHAGEETFAQLGEWPWPREVHARLLAKLGHADLVLLDVLFPERSDPGDDRMLAAVAGAMGSVVTAAHMVPDDGGMRVLPPYQDLREAASAVGVTNVDEDIDGLIRYAVPLRRVGKEYVPSLPLAGAARLLQAPLGLEGNGDGLRLTIGDHTVPLDRQGRMWINFSSGPPAAYEYGRVLDGRVEPETFKGKVVVVGMGASGLEDFHVVPDGGVDSQVIPGTRFNAEVLSTLLDGRVPGRISPLLAAGMTLALSLAAALLALWRRPLPGALVAGGVLLLFAGAEVLAFTRWLVWADMVAPAAGMAVAFTAASLSRMHVMHRDWTLKTFSITSLHDLQGQGLSAFPSLDAYLRAVWPEIQANTRVQLVSPMAGEKELPRPVREALRGACSSPDAPENGATVMVQSAGQPFPSTMAVPVAEEHGKGTLYTLVGWKGRLADETAKTIATTLLSASWFFNA